MADSNTESMARSGNAGMTFVAGAAQALFAAFCIAAAGLGCMAQGSRGGPQESVGFGRARGSYAVVVGSGAYAQKPWREVVDALRRKHDGALIVYSGDVGTVREALSRLAPRYACFVARPEEAGRKFVVTVHRLTRALDDDPYTDLLWGIVTGYGPEDALRIANRKKPLIVRRGLSATRAVGLGVFEEGIQFDEGRAGGRRVKGPDGKERHEDFPVDSTKGIVDALVDFKPQVFYTSGHAGETDWYIGYNYPDGAFTCKDGQVLARDTKKVVYKVNSPNSKVFLPLGNCSIGHIPRRDCMVTSMIRTCGVDQMAGYIVSTFFGYMGWGVNSYFIGHRSKYTLAESFYCSNQALIRELSTKFPKASRLDLGTYTQPEIKKVKEVHKVTEDRAICLLWDRDGVAFYGDPAWEVRFPPHAGAWQYSLTEKKGVHTLKVRATFDGWWGDRPLMFLLPEKVRDIKLLRGQEFKPVITDNFILLPLAGARRKKGQEILIEFRAQPLGAKRTSANDAPIRVQ